MIPKTFKKVIDLIKKTGDKCIVLDEEGEPVYVLMTFGDYQALVFGKSAPEVAGLTENELLEKINRDIAAWKAAQQVESLNNWQVIENPTPQFKKNQEDFFEEKSLNKANNMERLSEETDYKEDKYDFEPVD